MNWVALRVARTTPSWYPPAAPSLPMSLVSQLAVGGRMVVPVGNRDQQELVCALRTGEGISFKMLGLCRFVPLIGREAFPASP